MFLPQHLYLRYGPVGQRLKRTLPDQRSLTMATHEAILAAFEEYVAENQKFVEKGNKAAGTRARKALMEIAKLAKTRRAEITEEKEKDNAD